MPSSREEDSKEVSTTNIWRFSWQGFIHVTTLGCKRGWEIWLVAVKPTSRLLWKTGRMDFGGQPTFSTMASGSVEKHFSTAENTWEPLSVVENHFSTVLSWELKSPWPHGTWWGRGRCRRPESYIKRPELLSGQSSLGMCILGNSLPFFESQFPYL